MQANCSTQAALLCSEVTLFWSSAWSGWDFFFLAREEWRNSAGDSFASVLDQVEVLPINTSPGVDAVQWPWIVETGEDQVLGTCFWPHYLQSYPLPLLCQNDKQIPPFISILFPDLFSLERKSPRTYIILSPVTRKISTALVLYYVQYEVYCWK